MCVSILWAVPASHVMHPVTRGGLHGAHVIAMYKNINRALIPIMNITTTTTLPARNTTRTDYTVYTSQ